MKIKKPTILIILSIPFLVCLVWMFWHIRIYLPGSVTAEVVFADTEGTYGHDDLKCYTEDGTPVAFSYMYGGSKSGLISGSKVMVSGEIVSYKESYNGEANRSLQIVPIWLAWTMPIFTVFLMVTVLAEGLRYIRQQKVLKTMGCEKSDNTCKKNVEELLKQVECGEEPETMTENLRKNQVGIATVEFLKENFVGSDYGEKQGKPTLYYIEGIDVTSLLTADRTITLPYGVYEISVLGYTGRVRTTAGNYRYSEGYKASNTLKVVLNKDYPKLKIKVGRAVNSGAGRHLKVQRT